MQRSTVSAAVRASFRKCRLPPTPAHLRQSLHRAPGQLKAEGRYLVLGCSVPFYLNEARVSTARQRPPHFPFLLCPGLKQKRCPGVCGHNKLMECTSSVFTSGMTCRVSHLNLASSSLRCRDGWRPCSPPKAAMN